MPFGVVAPAASDSPAAKRLAGKERSRPFPCMDKPCGCATAEQCFNSCCCNTPAETLAWAKAHAVEPSVLTALERRVACAAPTVVKAPTASCCSSTVPAAEASCCTTNPPMAVSKPDGESPADQPLQTQPRARSVTLRAMLACGGIVAEWFAAGVALPPPRVEVSLTIRVFDVCTPGDESGECLRASPAAPPPRAV